MAAIFFPSSFASHLCFRFLKLILLTENKTGEYGGYWRRLVAWVCTATAAERNPALTT